MSALMRKHVSFLDLIASCSPKQRAALLKTASREQILTLCETALNIVRKLIPLTDGQLKRLRRYKKVTLALANRKVSIGDKRNHLVRQKGGFYTVLIPPALEILRALLS